MKTRTKVLVALGSAAAVLGIAKLYTDYKKNKKELLEEVGKVENEFKEVGVNVEDLNKGVSDDPDDPKRYSNLPWIHQLNRIIENSTLWKKNEFSINSSLGVNHGYNWNTIHVWMNNFHGIDHVNIGILVPPYFLDEGRVKISTYSQVLGELADDFWESNKLCTERPRTRLEGWYSVEAKNEEGGFIYEDISKRISIDEMLANSECHSANDGLGRLYTKMMKDDEEELVNSEYSDMYVFVKVDFPVDTDTRRGVSPKQIAEFLRNLIDTEEICEYNHEESIQKLMSIVFHPESDLGVYIDTDGKDHSNGRIIMS